MPLTGGAFRCWSGWCRRRKVVGSRFESHLRSQIFCVRSGDIGVTERSGDIGYTFGPQGTERKRTGTGVRRDDFTLGDQLAIQFRT